MMMPVFGLFLVLAVAGLVAVVIVIVLAAARGGRRQLPAAPLHTELVANQLAQLDQQLAAGQLSHADYATQRNRLLGLPEPDQR